MECHAGKPARKDRKNGGWMRRFGECTVFQGDDPSVFAALGGEDSIIDECLPLASIKIYMSCGQHCPLRRGAFGGALRVGAASWGAVGNGGFC